jgi:hypothetical protein
MVSTRLALLLYLADLFCLPDDSFHPTPQTPSETKCWSWPRPSEDASPTALNCHAGNDKLCQALSGQPCSAATKMLCLSFFLPFRGCIIGQPNGWPSLNSAPPAAGRWSKSPRSSTNTNASSTIRPAKTCTASGTDKPADAVCHSRHRQGSKQRVARRSNHGAHCRRFLDDLAAAGPAAVLADSYSPPCRCAPTHPTVQSLPDVSKISSKIHWRFVRTKLPGPLQSPSIPS